VVLAFERPNPIGGQPQRGVVVASGGWMLSYIADSIVDLGNGRVALTNPGNQEMLLASIAWLAGMDELIAPSPVSRQVARLEGIGTGTWLTWFSVGVLGLPLAALGMGMAVWMVRRN